MCDTIIRHIYIYIYIFALLNYYTYFENYIFYFIRIVAIFKIEIITIFYPTKIFFFNVFVALRGYYEKFLRKLLFINYCPLHYKERIE